MINVVVIFRCFGVCYIIFLIIGVVKIGAPCGWHGGGAIICLIWCICNRSVGGILI